MKDNIVGINTDRNDNIAALEQLKRESQTIQELHIEMAKIKYGLYKGYVDAGFTPEQALTLLISG
jgi:hypothetical protein